jgi:hypothetical protein
MLFIDGPKVNDALRILSLSSSRSSDVTGAIGVLDYNIELVLCD